VTLMLFIPF